MKHNKQYQRNSLPNVRVFVSITVSKGPLITGMGGGGGIGGFGGLQGPFSSPHLAPDPISTAHI